VSYEGLGKQWINGPGFIAWLTEMRPVEMAKNHMNGGGEGGRGTWANDCDLRAMYRAENEAGTVSLEVADRICVQLDIHIDSEMPEHLWVEKDPKGRKTRRTPREVAMLKEKARALLAAGHHPRQIAERLDLADRTVRNWAKEFAAEEDTGWLAGLTRHATTPKVWVREAA
jgi:hypothetical protein